uniref:CG-1 domain-containing protein n=1 Tax=Triticum urartu TaxID=4572 RepID=A0A8R7PBH4_TRIUA
MAEMHKYGLSNQPPDIPQILQEAQNRWLRPTEICQILSNYKKFSIAPEPPNRPPSMPSPYLEFRTNFIENVDTTMVIYPFSPIRLDGVDLCSRVLCSSTFFFLYHGSCTRIF